MIGHVASEIIEACASAISDVVGLLCKKGGRDHTACTVSDLITFCLVVFIGHSQGKYLLLAAGCQDGTSILQAIYCDSEKVCAII